MAELISLGVNDFKEVFGEITDRVARKIQEVNLQYWKLTSEERDEVIRHIIEDLLGSELEVVGEHRRARWEEGWSKNLTALKQGEEDSIVPYYFRKDAIARWRQEFIKPARPGFDRGGLSIIMEWLFEEYMKDAPMVCEFGCGTGHHLLQLRSVNPHAKLVGLDWTETSQNIIQEMVRQGKIDNVEGRRFDFFEPDDSFVPIKGSVIYTVGALEQVGNRHGAFVDYLLRARPALCVHVEPIAELLDPDNLTDYLAIEYFKKRNYLSGFLTNLRARESAGQLDGHVAMRTYLGGNMYVDHYSVIIWSLADVEK